MKVTKKQLKQIIKEELANVVSEADWTPPWEGHPKGEQYGALEHNYGEEYPAELFKEPQKAWKAIEQFNQSGSKDSAIEFLVVMGEQWKAGYQHEDPWGPIIPADTAEAAVEFMDTYERAIEILM